MNHKETIPYPELYYQVNYEWDDDFTCLNFVVFRVISVFDDSTISELEANPEFDGYVKFDGCMNVNLGQNHFCGRYATTQFAELFNKIYDKALEIGCDDK